MVWKESRGFLTPPAWRRRREEKRRRRGSEHLNRRRSLHCAVSGARSAVTEQLRRSKQTPQRRKHRLCSRLSAGSSGAEELRTRYPPWRPPCRWRTRTCYEPIIGVDCTERTLAPSPAAPNAAVAAAVAAADMPGFDYKFLEKPKRRFQCPLCSKAMREPVQVSTCGHRFCDTCLQEFLRYGARASLCVFLFVCVCMCVRALAASSAGDTGRRAVSVEAG